MQSNGGTDEGDELQKKLLGQDTSQLAALLGGTDMSNDQKS